ncbi:putative nuclease HARBI1 [Anthonomus grandis grandis]|uniref:putative nuclease HARBI1 n=1 Tax=Anthonomus grandis grandis TaxID=2921223 RepID=UPI0021667E14|nr:putative nuclease HARBI1 [Anthonomus grandis grandis]
MDLEDELFVDDDQEMLDIINFGFPRRNYERSEYFDSMDNFSFFRRFRLTKQTVLNFLSEIEDQIEYNNDLNNSLTPINQLLTTLRLYSCGNHQTAISDFIGCHQTTVLRTFRRVTRAICLTRPYHMRMPQNEHEKLRISTDYYNISRFPKVIGCVDGTYIRIQSPGGDDAEVFRNRKGYFSINTQVVGDSQLKIQDIVARWPGSAHDLTVFNNIRIRARFEGQEFQDSVLLGRYNSYKTSFHYINLKLLVNITL